MPNPFLLMAVFYLVVAILAAIDAALTGFSLLPWFTGLPWLRVHFITLGVLAETTFGVLPIIQASRRGVPSPSTRWDIWLLLNVGLIALVAGIPAVNSGLIIAGGTLVFLAALLLIAQLYGIGSRSAHATGSGKFYVVAVIYLLVGVLIGTGLWVGWSVPLHIGVPKEAHIHANSWGFASLLFAGLLIDLAPDLSQAPLAGRRAIDAIFWAMTVGALGLVAGPWLNGNLLVTVPGLLLHIAATVALLYLFVGMLRRQGAFARAGAWHLALSYVWILLPVLIAPLILLGVPGIPGADVEATAPQALIYGWVLQFLFAVVPYFAARWLLHAPDARLGGNWLSLLAVNAGSALIWLSIFLTGFRAELQGAAYVLLATSLVAAAWETGAIALVALRNAEGLRSPARA